MTCWKLRTTAERSTLRRWSESGRDMCTISWISLRKVLGQCWPACAPSSNTIRSLCTNSTRDIRMDTIDLKDVNKRCTCRLLSAMVWRSWKLNGSTESSNWSAEPKVVRVCRDSCGTGTESEKDDSCDPAHTREDSPHLVSSRAVV